MIRLSSRTRRVALSIRAIQGSPGGRGAPDRFPSSMWACVKRGELKIQSTVPTRYCFLSSTASLCSSSGNRNDHAARYRGRYRLSGIR